MSLPYMPLYVGDYLKDTRSLTTEQHGAYLLLLMDAWNCEGKLPNNAKALARITGVSPKRWPMVWSVIGEMFIEMDGFLRHKRVDLELQKADQISQKRRNAGSAGGRAKALNSQEADLANAKQMPSKRGTRSEPQPYKEEDDAKASSRVKPFFIPDDWSPSDDLMAWALAYKTPNNERLTEDEIRNEAASFVDYWTGRRDAKAKRPGWDGTFKARLRERTSAIVRARPRHASGGYGPVASGKHGEESIPDIVFRRNLERQNGNGVPNDGGRRHDLPAEANVIDGKFKLIG
jgi:uncharacterized protein YdaU (DUF1376 family)